MSKTRFVLPICFIVAVLFSSRFVLRKQIIDQNPLTIQSGMSQEQVQSTIGKPKYVQSISDFFYAIGSQVHVDEVWVYRGFNKYLKVYFSKKDKKVITWKQSRIKETFESFETQEKE